MLVMAAKTPIGVHKDSSTFSSVLSSAVLEWFLMLLLFVDGLFAYLVTKFARLCKLQTPCLICSRLDHILGNEKPSFYMDLICKYHKSEISSLAYCHVHQKLADVHGMCEGCLLSFATEKKSNSETYRSLVGKLQVDFDNSGDAHPKLPATVDGNVQLNSFFGEDLAKVPLLKKDPVSGSPFTRHCSCCSKQFKNKPYAIRFQNKPLGDDVAEAGISLSSSTGQSHLHFQNGLGTITDKSLVSTTINHSGHHGFDRLSHIGYSELKVNSDSESEVHYSDDDDGHALVCGTEDLKEEFMNRCLQPEPVSIFPNSLSMTPSNDNTLEKLIHPAPIALEHERSLSITEKQLHEGESHDISTLASTIAIGHGHNLGELNWSQVEVSDSPAPSTIISQKIPSENSDAKINIFEIGDVPCISSTSSGEISKALSSTDANLKISQVMNGPDASLKVHMDLNDAYKLATTSIGYKSLTSPTSTELVTRKDSSRVHDDLKSLISQISASRGFEFPWNDLSPSPRVNYQSDEFKFSDASSSAVLQNITKRLSIERNESGLESLDGSVVSEIEGESPLDRLKRQVELDRKSISLLYKELEEERNASAIAANQTMAMITRLQEEKAAMQMEALQYQRMMEEQAEYDQEALQKSNDLLAQREREIQDLETDFESYRKRLGDESVENKVLETFGDAEARRNSPTSTPLDKSVDHTKSDLSNLMFQDAGITEAYLKDSLVDFEDEKAYISDCLKKLEQKLYLFSNNGVYVDVSKVHAKEDGFPVKMSEDFFGENYEHENEMVEDNVRNGQYSEEAEINDLKNSHQEEVSQEKSQTLGEDLSENKHSKLTIKGDHKKGILFSDSDDDRQYSVIGRKSDLAALGNEVSRLTERLQALESDKKFLEHTINSLRTGDDGLRFIQEIASHLREIRRIGSTQR